MKRVGVGGQAELLDQPLCFGHRLLLGLPGRGYPLEDVSEGISHGQVAFQRQ